MLIGCACILMCSASFVAEVPPLIRERLAQTNETRGVFTQTKLLPGGERFVSSGEWEISPIAGFTWRITRPFDALFHADREKYCYSNEDEFVEKPLSELAGFAELQNVADGDFSVFFKIFDALYLEDDKGFHVLAKPKEDRISRFLKRVEADGFATNWLFRASFMDGSSFSIHIIER